MDNNNSNIKVKVVIEVSGLSNSQAIASALRPDNRTAPSWISIEEKPIGEKLIITIRAVIDKRRLGAIRNTVDELLSFMYSMLKTLESAAKTKIAGG